MRKMLFVEPVCVKALQDSADIEDLEQALHFLRGWPADRRGPVYQAAYKACAAARDGHLTIEEARRSLSGFARITGILRKSGPRPVPGNGASAAIRVQH